MNKIQRMSDSERTVMEVIWKLGKPLTTADLRNESKHLAAWKLSTLLTFLTRLEQKGLLDVEKNGKMNIYHFLVTKEEYIQFETNTFLANVHQGSVKSLISALCSDSTDLDAKELRKLKRWLDEL